MQRKAQPFQVSLQIEERTLLVSDVGEGYSLDQSQGQMQEDYAKPDSMEGIIELILYTRGSNPAICTLFLFFFSCNANKKLEMRWPCGKDEDKIAVNIHRGDSRGGNEKTPQPLS